MALPAKPATDGDSPEFLELIDASMETLGTMTSAHQAAWRLGEEERWDFAQDEGHLILTMARMIVVAPSQIIGTFDSKAGTWMWAWQNESIGAHLAKDSLTVKQYGRKHRIRRLTDPTWKGDEMDGWRMTALACRLCESGGAYRGPAGSTYVFFTFGQVQLKKR